MEEFLLSTLPERDYLLHPVIPEQGIVMLVAKRGIGKTFTALHMSLSVAGGLSLFNWHAPKARRVLYVDGEMPAISMQERLAALATGMAVPPHAMQNFSIITPDIQSRPMPDLATTYGQQALEPFLAGVDLLVLDNLATLCRTGKENESQSWTPMQTWLLDLRRRGMAVLLVHHAGKSGDQRGTSAREDIMDTVISLRRPTTYSVAEGARFEVHLTKARGIVGEDAMPFEVHLRSEGNQLIWDVNELVNVQAEQLKQLLAEGFSIRDCADEMGVSKSVVHRLKKKLEEGGDASVVRY
ncbi:MAG TPA: AAA family ATPase [Desulfovibrio sp.]|uniref:AAA family ATPase n=1 Tax=Desulfovibrio sp. TaxID=885 RepID=UPI002D69289C|nr:AAA family ATPase [Desulfovibrio sp.]HZF62365.1 AAA family ATPase [Desulfovibrio sp.]